MARLRNGLSLEIGAGSLVDCYADAVVVPADPALEWAPELARDLGRRAGRSTLRAAQRKAPVEVGEAVVTTGGGMLAAFLIHVALPAAADLPHLAADERRALLGRVVRNALLRCAELRVPSVGMPNLGSPLGLPPSESARLMLAAALAMETPAESPLEEVHLVLRDEAEAAAFGEASAPFAETEPPR